MGCMEKEPKVFVIVLNKDGKETLPGCLRSVFALSYGNFEVVVVDNASRDGSIETARLDFGRAHFVVNDENTGFSGGMNIGIRYALSKGASYVWLLNNDAVPERDSLSRLLRAAEVSGDAVFSPIVKDDSGHVWFSGGKIDFPRMRAEHVDSSPDSDKGEPYETGYLSGCALLLPKKAIERVGLLDEGYFLYYEDADYSIRAKKEGFRLLVVPSSVVIHSEASRRNPEKTYWLVRSGLRFFHVHTPVHLRPWMAVYLMLRKLKNRRDVSGGSEGALLVASAYRDYDADRKQS